MNNCYTASDHKAIEEGCYFDDASADRAVRYIEEYCTPSTLGVKIKLLPWQRDRIVRPLFGWKRADHRLRFKRATISMAKKNGKSLLSSAILSYAMFGGLCQSPFVASASTSRENASQIYRELAFSIRHHPKLKPICKCLDSSKEIKCRSKDARYRSFSADAGASEGENLSLCLVDETHAHQSDRLYRSLEYSTVARPDGLFVNVSTAGSDQGHFWYEVSRYASAVQSGEIIDTSLLAYVATTPEDADIEDPASWALSNPSLGTAFSTEDFRRDLDRAKAGGTADLLSFRRYRLNQWCRASDSYIDPIKYDRCLAPMTDAELAGLPLYVGCDLSQVADPSSISCVWSLPDKRYYVRNHSWVCEEGVRRREQTNLPKYRTFEADQVMTITPGTVNDYRKIKAHLLDLRTRYNLKEIIFDQFNALEMCAELMAEGITVYRQPQAHKYYTSPMKDFEVAITEGRILHDGNRLLRWALANTRMDIDKDGNCKPSRDKSLDKIDPAVSTLMSFGRAVACAVSSKIPYQDRGVLIF